MRRGQMYTWTRTANIHDGKLQDAFVWAVKVMKYINQKYPGTNIYVARNVDGPLYQVRWFATYDSLASYETFRKQIESDEGYRGLLAEIRGQDVLIGTSIVDSLYERIS